MVWWVRLQFLFPGFGFFFNDSCAQAEAQNPGANAETKPSILHLAAYQWLFPSLLLAPLLRGHSSSFRLLEFDKPQLLNLLGFLVEYCTQNLHDAVLITCPNV